MLAVNAMAVQLARMGRHMEAGPLREEVLEGREIVLGKMHTHTILAVSNFAYHQAQLVHRVLLSPLPSLALF